MNYDVFVSYSMSWSSRAYELSAQLDREHLRCYLDCVESGYALGDYTRSIAEESGVLVVLGDSLPATPYATALLQCVIGREMPVLLCLADGVPLPEELCERCTITTDAALLEDILRLLREEEEEEEEPGRDTYSAPLRPAASPWMTVEADEPVDEPAAPLYTESRGDIKEFYEACRRSASDIAYDRVMERRDEDAVNELERLRHEVQQRELEHALLPHDDEAEEAEETEMPRYTEHRGDIKEFYESVDRPLTPWEELVLLVKRNMSETTQADLTRKVLVVVLSLIGLWFLSSILSILSLAFS